MKASILKYLKLKIRFRNCGKGIFNSFWGFRNCGKGILNSFWGFRNCGKGIFNSFWGFRNCGKGNHVIYGKHYFFNTINF
jgi:hypothetical protein